MLKNTDKKTTVDDLLSSDAEEELRMEIKSLVRILNIFKSGVLMMDEVDLLLHPLRSELHWPLGLKLPLDFTQVETCLNQLFEIFGQVYPFDTSY
jgi:hypothetical protein